jgi:hypothetical protein
MLTAPSFLHDESAAVTADWVVLTAALVGLGLAVTSVVSGGMEDLSGDTRAVLQRGDIIRTSFFSAGRLFGMDFASGSGDWTGGEVVNLPGFGEVLRLGPGETVGLSVEMPAGARGATVTFDLLGLDDLSGPPAEIWVNGELVATYSDNHGQISHQDRAVEGVTVGFEQLYRNDAVGSLDSGNDSRATYTITLDDPGQGFDLEIVSTTGRPITEEAFAIDDVTVDVR